MSARHPTRLLWRVLAGVAASMALICTSTAWADPGEVRKVLIYTDLTPGALPHARAGYQTALLVGAEPTLVTTPQDFESQLVATNWNEVAVAVKWQAQEPSSLGALRTFSAAHPSAFIMLSAWHDNGKAVPSDEAVFATTAQSVWAYGTTNTGYIWAKSDDRQDPRRETGLLWPSFVDVTPADPEAEWYVTSATAYVQDQTPASQPTTQPNDEKIPDPICVAQAMVTCFTDLVGCFNDRAEMETNCDKVHGPLAPEPDPEKFAKCMQDAADGYKECNSSKLRLYKSRVSRCPKVPKPQPQEP